MKPRWMRLRSGRCDVSYVDEMLPMQADDIDIDIDTPHRG